MDQSRNSYIQGNSKPIRNGRGAFTYYVLEGLKGSADANRDHLVTIGELFRYVRQKVRLDTQFQQNPRMLIGDNENLALAAAR